MGEANSIGLGAILRYRTLGTKERHQDETAASGNRCCLVHHQAGKF
jgi:hypothetical protein